MNPPDVLGPLNVATVSGYIPVSREWLRAPCFLPGLGPILDDDDDPDEAA